MSKETVNCSAIRKAIYLQIDREVNFIIALQLLVLYNGGISYRVLVYQVTRPSLTEV